MNEIQRPILEPMLDPAPSVLTIQEVFEGTGVEAPVGATVKVHYLGVDYETGEEFDSSWGRGTPIEFPLNRLIKGWQEGIPGMKVGGRRTLICPPEYAYGPVGGGHHLSGRTLVFVIDLLGVV
jgi:peptidylprolyl isomerase